jgi:hypothetical protein
MLTTSGQSGAAFGVDVQSSANDFGVAEHAGRRRRDVIGGVNRRCQCLGRCPA